MCQVQSFTTLGLIPDIADISDIPSKPKTTLSIFHQRSVPRGLFSVGREGNVLKVKPSSPIFLDYSAFSPENLV